jgi:hypothetical protein
MSARGERAERGNPNSKPDIMSGLKTTGQLAEEAGMHEKTYQRGHAVGCQPVA